MNAANRIIFNTAITYASLVIKMIIGFFSVRLILSALGESDYGVYTIVAGVAGMLGILNGNMANTSMRYMAHSLGSNNIELIKKTFSTTLAIHYLVGCITILIMEIGGWVMFQYLLNIPDGKLTDAIIIYQFTIISTFISIIAVPYDAVMNAHEHIWILSLFDILSALLNLAMALYLFYMGGNKLILYGLFMMLIQVLLRIMKLIYSRKRYIECKRKSRTPVDKQLTKDILSFTGWNFLGSLAALGTTQFRSIIVNMFFGVLINAAEGVSRQASGQVNLFVASLTRAINPQIMKSEGGGDHQRMIYITEVGAKYSSCLFALIGVPIALEAEYLLNLWLKDVPQYAVAFCQLIMIQMLVEKFTFQLTHAIRAVGNIRNFQIFESIACFVYLPFAYIFFKLGYSPVTIYVLGIANSFLVAAVRLYFGQNVAGINVGQYLKASVLPVIFPLVISVTIYFLLKGLFVQSFFSVLFKMAVVCVSFLVSFYYIGLSKSERMKWKDIFDRVLTKICLNKLHSKNLN